MKLLIVGGGGREHALALALATDDPGHEIFVAPGNPGTAPFCANLSIAADDIERLVRAASAHSIELVVVGPEVPLALGLADALRGAGHLVFGPGAAAARIESSKAFSKDVMASAGVPTAASEVFTALQPALAHVDVHPEPLVVKASGLAAGKGAVVCITRAEARAAVTSMLGERAFGEAGDEVVIETFLQGEELSVFAVTNGTEIRLLPSAQDHKRLLDGDTGPNTGGMGAYAPVAIATGPLLDRVEREVLRPTLAELSRRGAPFVGVLYAGLMIAPDGTPNVIEFNCRFGDPEAEVILPLVKSGLTALLVAAARGEPLPRIEVHEAAAVTVVLAAGGYPEAASRGDVITIPDDMPDGVTVFHAGTRTEADGTLVTSGGRVLAVTAVAPTFEGALERSSAAAEMVEFEGKQMRRDIGWRELERRSR
ncbi:MAG: phosphoribosylamine--glycine ligase [Gemmatimonadales bacterium]|nr:phosphoribosylamine--glycine ligase [Gemmatimonadales bacterium]